jgi:hypothetical protein
MVGQGSTGEQDALTVLQDTLVFLYPVEQSDSLEELHVIIGEARLLVARGRLAALC